MPSAAPFRRLRRGDAVAVVAPASPPPAHRVAAGVQVLRAWGLEPEVLPSVSATHDLPHLAGSDALRAAELVQAWRDPDIAAIWCARGGYGVQRILDLLPRDLFSQGRAKPIIGFSDVTPLLHRAMRDSRVQMVHGPMVVALGESSEEVLTHVHRLLFERALPRTLLTGLTAWVGGDRPVSGPLLGGNVTLLAASLGTNDLPSAEGAVVLLEDVGQEQWAIDRAVTQLIRSGWFDGAAGIVVGDVDLDDDPDLVERMLRDRLLPLGIPVWAGAPVGHQPCNLALPIGAQVRVSGGYLRYD
jgi:muramoyltetrapeptide carboxypeptidase